MKPLSLPLLTLYADLQQQLETAVAPAGSVFRQEVAGVAYLRAQVMTARGRRTLHIGPESDPDAVARAAAISAEMERSKERRKIISSLKRSGFGAPSPEMGSLLEALGRAELFGQGAVLVGTGAYQCFAGLVGFALPSAALVTQDADLATASLALTVSEDTDGIEGDVPASPVPLIDVLRSADHTFTGLPGLDKKALPSRFRSASGFVLDILVPQRRRTDTNPMPIKGLAAGGIPLQHLDWLIADPVRAVALHGSGILVNVPAPARYAVHKLVIAQKRPRGEGSKRFKDLEQAKTLIEALEARDRWALRDALDDARAQGEAGWADRIARSLEEIGRAGL